MIMRTKFKTTTKLKFNTNILESCLIDERACRLPYKTGTSFLLEQKLSLSQPYLHQIPIFRVKTKILMLRKEKNTKNTEDYANKKRGKEGDQIRYQMIMHQFFNGKENDYNQQKTWSHFSGSPRTGTHTTPPMLQGYLKHKTSALTVHNSFLGLDKRNLTLICNISLYAKGERRTT